MNAPWIGIGAISVNQGLALALLIGLGFGWFLERGGLGNARKLAGQFYLTDLTVLKVMFSAIITAALGLFWLSRLGLVDLTLVYLPPTFLLPQLLGGLVFGFGFVMGGLCPGTSCVAAASGRIDGMALLGGMLFGVFVFNEIYPLIAEFYASTPLGQITLAEYFNLPHGLLVFAIVVMGLLAFRLAEYLENNNRS
jgi:uncharacterized membrane protein YedE/YeeE